MLFHLKGERRRTDQITDAGLAAVSTAWHRYIASNPKKPDSGLAAHMVTAYSPVGLNRPPDAAQAAEIVANSKDDAQAYLQLTGCAALAGQTRKADLAGQTAIDRASKAQKAQAKQAVKAAKAPPTPGQFCGGPEQLLGASGQPR